MKLYLIRHGETSWNREGKFQGRVDVPLNDNGRDLARITRDNMPVVNYDRVYCSPLCRAIETAHILLEGRFPLSEIQLDDRIVELDFGIYEGSSISEAGKNPEHPLYNMLWHPELYLPGDKAESFAQLVERADDFLSNEIMPLEAMGVDNVLVVAHGAMIRAFVCAVGKKQIADFWGARYMNCCLTTFDIQHGEVTLLKEAEIFYDPANYVAGWKK
ncbi:MAG: histidine phosphatase family protein [Bacteroidales bacterium]|nr:histidine phosphatase family protein [Bacteroidales bacterium]